MKVSELAKELGYKTPELVVVAKLRGIDLADKSELPAQIVAVIKAKVPSASRLTGPDKDTLKNFQEVARKERKPRSGARKRKRPAKKRSESKSWPKRKRASAPARKRNGLKRVEPRLPLPPRFRRKPPSRRLRLPCLFTAPPPLRPTPSRK
jgi:hypothetical protein